MRLHVRVPIDWTWGRSTGRGISHTVAAEAIEMEASLGAAVGSRLALEVDLLGSGRRLAFSAEIGLVAPLAGRVGRLLTLGGFEMQEGDDRAWAAWLVERAPLVQRGRSTREIAGQAVRGALFEVSPGFALVTVAWPTRASFARTFREELVHNRIRVRGAAGASVGASTKVAFLIPQGIPAQVPGTVVAVQGGEAEVRVEVPPEVALRLASYARG
jgi:hypothetical protein